MNRVAFVTALLTWVPATAGADARADESEGPASAPVQVTNYVAVAAGPQALVAAGVQVRVAGDTGSGLFVRFEDGERYTSLWALDAGQPVMTLEFGWGGSLLSAHPLLLMEMGVTATHYGSTAVRSQTDAGGSDSFGLTLGAELGGVLLGLPVGVSVHQRVSGGPAGRWTLASATTIRVHIDRDWI